MHNLAYPHPAEARTEREADVDSEPNVEGDAWNEMGEYKERNATQRRNSEYSIEGE
jgi:hypothetical protein